jgi:hypothetical protein
LTVICDVRALTRLLDHVTHYDFSVSLSIGFRVVEEVDPGVVCGGHAFLGDVFAYLPAISDP